MNCILFWVGQIGIAFEIFGAAYIVLAAYKSYKILEKKSPFIDASDLMESTRIEVGGQFKKEVKGFIVLAIGLFMQFLGGFST